MKKHIAIVGAGMAGLSAACMLRSQGHEIHVFDKARGPGGRSSTRRADSARFDHGAQYFTMRDPNFMAFLEECIGKEHYSEWRGRFVSLRDDGSLADVMTIRPRYVGVPGMNALCKALAERIEAHYTCHIEKIERKDNRWMLYTREQAKLGPYDFLVVTCPPRQAEALVAPYLDDETAAELAGVTMHSNFTVMLVPEGDAEFPADGITCRHPLLGWVANNHSKPGRDAVPALVIQANADWSRKHIELDTEEAGKRLTAAAESVFDISFGTPRFMATHRWLYSQPETPMQKSLLIDHRIGLALCGDWCGGTNFESAFLSAHALASIYD
jgi:predicted NAD/FAD-dependent oxidoreductase